VEAIMNCNRRSLWIPFITTGVLTSVCLAGPIATAAAQDQGTAVRIVADQVRSQGFRCNNPSSAERIAAESIPNETVYLLKCEGVTYRVVLIPDQAAKVTGVD
jgi:hypothetical protein